MMTPEAERTLASYEPGGVLLGLRRAGSSLGPIAWLLGLAFRGLFGGGVRGMTATDRRLIVDHGAGAETTIHYAPGMLVDCYPRRHPSPLRRLAFPAVCALFAAALLREGYPSALLAAAPAMLLVASVLRDALLVCVEVRRLPDLGEDRNDGLRATIVASRARRLPLLAFLRRVNDAVADHNALRTGHSGRNVPEADDLPDEPDRETPDGDTVLSTPFEELFPEEGEEEEHPTGTEDLLAGLLEGRRTEGEPEDNEAALLDGLEFRTRRSAFSPVGTDHPWAVVAGLPGFDRVHDVSLIGEDPADGGAVGAIAHTVFVLNVPTTFPYARYVARYQVESATPAVAPAGRRALSAWLEEAPLAPAGRAGRFVGVLRGLLNRDERVHVRAWLSAFPGLLGPYRPRVRGRWRLQPAGGYAVRMNFYEEIGPDDFYARDGGLRDAYPPSLDWGPPVALPGFPRSCGFVDCATGDVVVWDGKEASAIADLLEEEFSDRGVLCDPAVELTDPFDGPFELRGHRAWHNADGEKEGDDSEEDDGRGGSLAETAGVRRERERRQGPDQNEPDSDGMFVPLVEREWRERVSAAVLPEDLVNGGGSEPLLLRAFGYVDVVRRIADLERRLSDPLIPQARKDALVGQLSDLQRRRREDLSALVADPEALVTFAAQAGRERALFGEVARLAVRDAGSRCDSFEMRLRLRELAEEREAGGVDRAR